ncbi:MAG: hypothetical protein RLY16_182 [Bacteroidota bacterium]
MHQFLAMLKIFSFFAAILLIQTTAAQSIAGDWSGKITVQTTELPIEFHIKDSAGVFSATFDSPKQQAYGLPCSGVELKGDSLYVFMKMINGKYVGQLSPDHKRAFGTWYQGINAMSLDLQKTSDVVTKKELKRPQTPKPPYSYNSEEVIYNNADSSIRFGATLTTPLIQKGKLAHPAPAAILITGSGKQDRDETIFQHKPFAVIADYLTRNGYVVLRVDDRGEGKTTGKFNTATTADFAKDVAAGIRYLKTRAEVDTNQIGLIGHSEGGMIAPMVAVNNPSVHWIILLAGTGAPIIDMMTQQNVDILKSNGLAEADALQYGVLYKNIVTLVAASTDTVEARKKAAEIFDYWQQKQTPEMVRIATGVTNEKSRDQFLRALIYQLKQPWFDYFIKQDPAQYLSKLNGAVLALNGEKDIQVNADLNINAIKKTIGKQAKLTTKIYPQLNHLFQHCTSCTVDEYGVLEETFSTEVLADMVQWLDKTTQLKK